MTEKPASSTPPNPKPTEPWRVERMVQPVPAHLGEDARFSPWLVVAAVAAFVVIGTVLLFLSQAPATPPVSSGSSIVNAEATPTRRITVIRITATPQPTDTQTAVPTPAFIKYTVKKNDTLSTIARQFKVSVEAIRAANNLKNDTIRVGDVLTIPQGTPTPGALSNVPPPSTGGSGPATAPTNTPLLLRTPTLMAFASSLTPATPTTPTPTPGVVSYVVRPNDTLISIAAVYSTTVQSIMTLSQLTGPGLKVGQVLTVPVGIWIPTSTPTVYNTPTPASTPQFSYAAPDLLFPVDGADFAHEAAVTLQWLSLGIKSDEYYVVHLSYEQDGVITDLPGYIVGYDEGTSITLNTSPAPGRAPAQFSWYVVVVRGSGCAGSDSPSDQPCAVSPVSGTFRFNWR